VKLREDGVLIRGQQVLLAHRLTEGRVVEAGTDYKSAAFLPSLHGCGMKGELACASQLGRPLGAPAAVQSEEVPVLARSALQQQS